MCHLTESLVLWVLTDAVPMQFLMSPPRLRKSVLKCTAACVSDQGRVNLCYSFSFLVLINVSLIMVALEKRTKCMAYLPRKSHAKKEDSLRIAKERG